jgi:hypothetical protein
VELILGRGADEVNRAILAGRMRTLAANLATARALCRAYWYGRDYIRWDSAERWAWRPGCGRAMPGWGGAP